MKKTHAVLFSVMLLLSTGCASKKHVNDQSHIDQEIQQILDRNEALILSLEIIDAGMYGKFCRELLDKASAKGKIPRLDEFEETCGQFSEKSIIAVEHFYEAPSVVRGDPQVIEDFIAMDRMRAELHPKIQALQKRMMDILNKKN